MEILKLVSYFDLSKYSALYELSVAEWCYVVWRYRSTLVNNNNITKLHTLHQPLSTHWGKDKMALNLQRTFQNSFSWVKIIEFWFKFHCNHSKGVQLTIIRHWFRYRLGTEEATSHYLNHWWPKTLMNICITQPQWVKSISQRTYLTGITGPMSAVDWLITSSSELSALNPPHIRK